LSRRGDIKTGQKLLINGAGGGVGTFALQIAKLFEAEVTGVDSSEKFDMMLSLGFDHVIDYKKEDFTKNGQHYNLILDNKTSYSAYDYVKSLSPNGRYVTTGGNYAKLIKLLIFAPLISRLYKKKMYLVILKPNKDLAYINELFEAGKIHPVIDGHYKLEEVPEAFRYFGEGHHKGKVVITL